MKIIKLFSSSLPYVFKVLAASALASVALHLVFMAGYVFGFNKASGEINRQLSTIKEGAKVSSIEPALESPTPTPLVVVITPTPRPVVSIPNWSGPELWDAVNSRRQQLGVNPMANQSELCTIASIRLNELLDLGELDGHEGFSNLPERRPDLKWIFEKYNISEFLVSGAKSAEEAVDLWENTLGHKKLLTGGEYVWGCTYAQNSFGVAIAAY